MIKQVPEMEKVRFDNERGVIDRKSAGTEINPFDLNALETAVQIKENCYSQNSTNTSIITISMGPDTAESALKEAISRGADEAVLLSDKKFSGSDTWATALTLTKAIQKIDNLDLIITGNMSVDGDTAQVGPQVAELLNIPHSSFVSKIEEFNTNNLVVTSELTDGIYLKQLEFPCLISVTKDINTPRLPSLKSKMKAKKTEIVRWKLEDLGSELDQNNFGLKGSPTQVKNIVIPPTTSRKGKLYDQEEHDQALDDLAELIMKQRIMEG